MNGQGFQLLLVAVMSLLVLTIVYAVWLKIQLWLTEQAFNRIAVIQADRGRDEAPAGGGGCVGTFLLLLVVVLLLMYLLTSIG